MKDVWRSTGLIRARTRIAGRPKRTEKARGTNGRVEVLTGTTTCAFNRNRDRGVIEERWEHSGGKGALSRENS